MTPRRRRRLPPEFSTCVSPKMATKLNMSCKTTTGSLNKMIEALREELRQYGEMLARFDDQQKDLPGSVLASVASLHDQGMVIQNTSRRREKAQRELARQLRRPEEASLREEVRLLPLSHQPMVRALMDESDDLALLVQ